MKEKLIIHVFNDPAHGWGRVKISMLEKLGIADKITPYSYMRGSFAYLEEDCDLATLIKALKSRNTPHIHIEFRDHHSNRESRIRRYQRYECKPN